MSWTKQNSRNYQLHCPLLYDSRRWTSQTSTPSYSSLSFFSSAACHWNFWNGICTKVCLSNPVTSLRAAFSKILDIPAIMCCWLQRKVGHGSCSSILHLDAALTVFLVPVKFNDESVNLSLLHPGSIPSSACAIYSVTFATAFNTPPFIQGAPSHYTSQCSLIVSQLHSFTSTKNTSLWTLLCPECLMDFTE